MRRRELQSIQLKLSELKEYEQAKIERAKARQVMVTPHTPPTSSDSDVLALTTLPVILLSGSTEEDATPKPSTSSN